MNWRFTDMGKHARMEIIRGSGNVFRDLGQADADREQLRAVLAARIIRVLDDRKLTAQAANELTGIAAADFSRLRQTKLGRISIDRIMAILAGLGQQVDVAVDVNPQRDQRMDVELRS